MLIRSYIPGSGSATCLFWLVPYLKLEVKLIHAEAVSSKNTAHRMAYNANILASADADRRVSSMYLGARPVAFVEVGGQVVR